MNKKDKAGSIVKSRPKKDIPVPEIKFEEFWTEFDTVADIMETDEWKNIYSNYYNFEEIEKDIQINESREEMDAYDIERQTQEIIKCANSFTYFCIKYGKINHPIAGLIPLVPYTYQRRVIECYGKNRFNILSKFRQGGLTTISVMWALWRCLFKTGQRIMVVSKTDREAIAAGVVAKSAMENLPLWMKPETDECNKHEKQFKTTHSVLWFYTIEAARGKSITILIIDEAAFITNMHEHWKGLYPVVATGGCCAVVSTVNGLGNWYEETYHEAEEGKNPFNIIELDYWEHPLYNDPKWINSTRSILTEKGWQQEIERNFLSSGDTWLNGVVLTAINDITRDNMPIRMKFDKWKNKGSERRNDWDEGALWIWKLPLEGHEYVIGVDCAEGVGNNGDNSCFEVIDQATLEQVAEFYSNTIPPHIFAQILNEFGYFYNTALLVVENVNQGCAVLSTLQHDLSYESLFCEQNKQASVGIKPSKNSRPLILQCLQQRLLNGTLRVNSNRFATELNTFMFNATSKKPEAQRGKHDDSIIALALALYVRDSQLRGIPVGAEIPDEMMQIFRSESYEEIKNEIHGDTMEDILKMEDSSEIYLLSEQEQMVPGMQYRFKRANDGLLREFGW